MREAVLKKNNRKALICLCVFILMAFAWFFLPVYRFRTTVYTKKSGNTFVGDDRYLEAKKEAEEMLSGYQEQGMNVKLEEKVTERTNSKGEKTSMVAFSISQVLSKSLIFLLGSGFGGGRILALMLLCFVLCLCFALAGLFKSEDVLIKFLSAGSKLFRTFSVICSLLSFILAPGLILFNNYTFWRRQSLYGSDLIAEGKEAYQSALNDFLFGGRLEDLDSLLKSVSMEVSGSIWLLVLFLFGAVVAALYIRCGNLKKPVMRLCLYLFILVVSLVILYPYYVMTITAFRSNAETLDMYFMNLLPVKWLFGNMKDIVSRGVLQYLFNSLKIAGGGTALAMVCGIPAAYALARMEFKGKKFFLGFVIMSQMFSPVVLLIGIAQLMNILHLSNTILGLVFVNAAFNQAFAVWLLRGTFVSISPEMEQAAKIDGCGKIGALVRVLLPMSAPGIVTTLIFVFINAWNEYTISTVLISTASKRPITVGITQFSSFNMIEWQYLFAASLLATIPVVIMFMFIEKYLTSGLTSGGVKG